LKWKRVGDFQLILQEVLRGNKRETILRFWHPFRPNFPGSVNLLAEKEFALKNGFWGWSEVAQMLFGFCGSIVMSLQPKFQNFLNTLEVSNTSSILVRSSRIY